MSSKRQKRLNKLKTQTGQQKKKKLGRLQAVDEFQELFGLHLAIGWPNKLSRETLNTLFQKPQKRAAGRKS